MLFTTVCFHQWSWKLNYNEKNKWNVISNNTWHGYFFKPFLDIEVGERVQLVPENIGVYKSHEKHDDDENCFKDETKFKNNINNVTCEAKLMETFPSIVPNIAATKPYNVLPLAFRSRLTRSWWFVICLKIIIHHQGKNSFLNIFKKKEHK